MFLLGFSLRHLTSYLKSKYHILLPVTQVCNSKFLQYLLRKHCFELLHFQNISIKIISIKIISNYSLPEQSQWDHALSGGHPRLEERWDVCGLELGSGAWRRHSGLEYRGSWCQHIQLEMDLLEVVVMMMMKMKSDLILRLFSGSWSLVPWCSTIKFRSGTRKYWIIMLILFTCF